MQELKPIKEGKVREIYDNGDSLIMVATDRISCFDVILHNEVTSKGAVLTQKNRRLPFHTPPALSARAPRVAPAPKRRRALFIIHDSGRKTKGILWRQIAEKGLTGGKKGNKMNTVQFGGRTR